MSQDADIIGTTEVEHNATPNRKYHLAIVLAFVIGGLGGYFVPHASSAFRAQTPPAASTAPAPTPIPSQASTPHVVRPALPPKTLQEQLQAAANMKMQADGLDRERRLAELKFEANVQLCQDSQPLPGLPKALAAAVCLTHLNPYTGEIVWPKPPTSTTGAPIG